jgi:hypothetical protein
MENLPYCPGRQRISDLSRKWYIPHGKTSSECTYCELCFTKYIKDTPRADLHTIVTDLYQCNCDYPKDYSEYALDIQGIRVTVTSKRGELFPKLGNTLANLNGVVHVCVPTCTEYYICVEKIDGTLNCEDDIYLTFESGSVGNTPIVMNNGKRLYYPMEFFIKGFKNGPNESFMFMSQSKQEKGEGKTLKGENETNVITVKVQKWKRVKNQLFSKGLERNSRSFGMENDFFEFHCDNDSSRYYSLQGGDCSRSRGRSESSTRSTTTFSGGATVSGGWRVDSDRSQTTSDSFDCIGSPIEFIIQLVCGQSDDEKYQINKQYYLQKSIEERTQLQLEIRNTEGIIENYKRQVEDHKRAADTYQANIDEKRLKLDELNNTMKKYDYLGSTVKTDHLLDLGEETNTRVIKLE